MTLVVDSVKKKNKVAKQVKEREGIKVATRVQKKPLATRVKPRVQTGAKWWEEAGPSGPDLRDRTKIKDKSKRPYWMGVSG